MGRADSFPKTGKIASVPKIKIMTTNLIEQLQKVPDFRTSDGQRHPLWLVLLFMIMGIMNGAVGYRACGDFVKRHRRELIERFKLQRHGVPSYSTIRRVAIGVDFNQLESIFNDWAKAYVEVETGEWYGIDGKSIKGTVKNHDSSGQNFVSIVSVFTGKRGLTLGMKKFETKQESEIKVVQDLITALDLTGAVLTFDSLHCQKKTCELIIEGGSDYVIAVKDNQPNLHQHIQRVAAMKKPASRDISIERTRDRVTKRTVEVFHDLTGIHPAWIGIKSLIKVERVGIRMGKKYHETVCYVSSVLRTAQEFANGIRGHWGIENRLHWVKDVVFKEDASTIRKGNAPANLSIIRTIAINILRRNNYTSITSSQRFLSHDIDKLIHLVE